MQTFFLWLPRNGPYFLVIPLVIALFRIRYLIGPLRWTGSFVGLAVLGEIVGYITVSVMRVKNNVPIVHLYTLLEFNVIALFYLVYFRGFYGRLLVPGMMLIFTVLVVLNSVFLQPLFSYNTYARSLEGVLVIALSLLGYYKLLAELPTKRLDQSPIFWINTGLLLYFAGNLFFFILGNALLKEPNQSFSLMAWGLSTLLMVLMHLFISVGLWFSPQLR